jgi:hypothetical protein
MSKPTKPHILHGQQSKAFIEAARAIGCDEDPAHFDEILKKVARHKPPPNAPPEPKKSKIEKPDR